MTNLSIDTHPNVHLLRRGYEAIEQRDATTLLTFLGDDVTWHVGGDGPLAGAHRGRNDVLGLFMTILEATGDEIRHEVLDVFADDDCGVVVYRTVASGNGLRYDEVDVTRFRFVGGLVAEAWEHPFDQRGFDALMA